MGVFHGLYDHKSFTSLYESKMDCVMFTQFFAGLGFFWKNFGIIYRLKTNKKKAQTIKQESQPCCSLFLTVSGGKKKKNL